MAGVDYVLIRNTIYSKRFINIYYCRIKTTRPILPPIFFPTISGGKRRPRGNPSDRFPHFRSIDSFFSIFFFFFKNMPWTILSNVPIFENYSNKKIIVQKLIWKILKLKKLKNNEIMKNSNWYLITMTYDVMNVKVIR